MPDDAIERARECLIREGMHEDTDAAIGLVPYAVVVRAILAFASQQAPEGWATLGSVWLQAEQNHRLYSDTGDHERDIQFLTLGLAGEAGEVANFVKKRWRDGDGHDDDIRKEIADVCAYAFMLANTMGMTPGDLMQVIADKQAVFVAKMQARPAMLDAAPSAVEASPRCQKCGGDDVALYSAELAVCPACCDDHEYQHQGVGEWICKTCGYPRPDDWSDGYEDYFAGERA